MSFPFQLLVGLFTFALSGLGLRAVFAPLGMGQAVFIRPQGAPGLNTVGGALGGLFVASATMLGLGLATGQTLWFLAVAVIMASVIFGRLVGIVFDGFHKDDLPPLAIEAVITGGLVAAHLSAAA